MIRCLIGAALTFGISLVPIQTVRACSCAMPGGVADTIAQADLAFLGTVVDVAPAPQAPGDIGRTIRYAFEVERASVTTEAVVEVRSLDDPGGAACGFAFGIGERWFVAAHRDGQALQTNLCSGNIAVDGMPPDELAAASELLAAEPEAAADTEPAAGGAPSPVLLLTIGAGALAGLATIMIIAFRRPGRSAEDAEDEAREEPHGHGRDEARRAQEGRPVRPAAEGVDRDRDRKEQHGGRPADPRSDAQVGTILHVEPVGGDDEEAADRQHGEGGPDDREHAG
jgi:hypothetical protein